MRIKILFLIAVSKVGVLAYGDTKLIPSRVSVCSAILGIEPTKTAQRGVLRYELNGMSSDIFHHLQRLRTKALTPLERGRKLVWQARPSNVLKSFLGRQDDDVPGLDHRVSAQFRNLTAASWTPRRQKTIANILSRVRQLDDDFNDPGAKVISFGDQRRGADEINAYLDLVEAQADRIEGPVFEKYLEEHPYLNRRNLGAALFMFPLASAMALSPILWADTVSKGDYRGLVESLLVAAYIGPDVVKGWLKHGQYLLGTVHAETRIKFENRDRRRAVAAIRSFEAMRDMAVQPPASDSFIFHSETLRIHVSLVEALIHNGSDKMVVPADTRELLDSAREDAGAEISNPNDYRYLLTDQFMYFDVETHEPVLVTYVRIKRTLSLTPKKRNPPQVEAKPAYDPSGVLVPGLSR